MTSHSTPSDMIARLRRSQWGLPIIALALLWPAAINGGPFIFADTPSYIRGADALVLRVTGHESAWSNRAVRRIAPARPAATNAPPAPDGEAKPVLLGRSIFYGVLLYFGVAVGSLWAALIVQALFVGAIVVGLLRHVVEPSDERRFLLTVVGTLAALAATPVGFFASMLMPDVFTGTTIVAAAVLIAGWRRERAVARWFWFAVAGYGALVHSSHVMLLMMLAAGALVVSLWSRSISRPGASAVLLAAAVGLAGEAAFSFTVREMTGSPPIRPPFLTARLVEDGPGSAYLAAHCAPPAFFLCRYRDRLPLPSDGFLWASGKDGVFETLTPAGQRELSGEQGRFVAAVVADRPVAVIRSSLAAIGRQASAWSLVEFNEDPMQAAQIARQLPDGTRQTYVASAAYRRSMPTNLVTALIPIWTAAGLIAIILTARRGDRSRAVATYGLVLIAGWVADVVLCGALSTPHDRYHARVIWLMALWVVVAAAAARRQTMSPAR